MRPSRRDFCRVVPCLALKKLRSGKMDAGKSCIGYTKTSLDNRTTVRPLSQVLLIRGTSIWHLDLARRDRRQSGRPERHPSKSRGKEKRESGTQTPLARASGEKSAKQERFISYVMVVFDNHLLDELGFPAGKQVAENAMLRASRPT